MRSILLGQLLFSLMALSACAATSGQSWVREPVDVNSDTDAAFAARELEPMPEAVAIPPTAREANAQASLEEPRPRLSRVISLGEGESSGRPAAAATQAPQPGVVVNIVNYANSPYASGYGYGYGYGPIYRAGSGSPPAPATLPSTTPSTPSGSPPPLAGDWGRAPSYGPAFPWRTAPASPWERSR